MNAAKAIEIAFAEVVRKHATLGEDVLIRPWQSLERDGSWDKTKDRDFPVVDIRCAPPKWVQTQVTFSADCALLAGTKLDDDKSHAVISDLYEALQSVLDRLYAQVQMATPTGDEWTTFSASLAENLPTTVFHFGGLTYGDVQAPWNDRGVNMIGITMVVHYARPDC